MDEVVLINIQTAHYILTSNKAQRITDLSSVLYHKIVNIGMFQKNFYCPTDAHYHKNHRNVQTI